MTPSLRFLTVLVVVTLVLPPSVSLAQPSYREFRPQVLGGQTTLAQKLPDLVIVSATPAGDCTAAYANINVTVTIKNIGKGPAVMPEPLAWAPWVAVWDKGSQDFWHLPYVTWIASGAPA